VWTADPYNNLCEVNQFGEANSVVAVSERTAPIPVSVPMSGPMSAPTAAM